MNRVRKNVATKRISKNLKKFESVRQGLVSGLYKTVAEGCTVTGLPESSYYVMKGREGLTPINKKEDGDLKEKIKELEAYNAKLIKAIQSLLS